MDAAKLIELVAYLIVVWLTARVKEAGFERLISQPIIEQYLKAAKPFQPYIVLALGIGLAFAFRLDVLGAINAVTPFASAPGDVAQVVSGAVIAILAMAAHAARQPGDLPLPQ